MMMTVPTILIKMLVGQRWRWVKGKQLVMFCWHQQCTCTLGREKSPQIFNQFRDTTWWGIFWVGAEYILETDEVYVHGHHPSEYMHWIENELACIFDLYLFFGKFSAKSPESRLEEGRRRQNRRRGKLTKRVKLTCKHTCLQMMWRFIYI